MNKRLCFVLPSLLVCVAAMAEPPLGWRVGVAAWTFNRFTFFEAVEKTASLGISNIEAFQGQRVMPDSEAVLDVTLSDELIAQVRAKLDEAKVTLTSIYIHDIPGDEAACRRIFDFAKKLGVGFIVSEPAPEALDMVEKCCNEYAINVAIHNHPRGSSRYWEPAEVLKVCEGRGPRIGACADTGHWLRCGIRPVEGVRLLGKRLLAVHLKDLDKAAADAVDRPWGQGCGETEQVLRALREIRVNPALFAIEYESEQDNNMAQVDASAKWFTTTTIALAAEAAAEAPLFVGWASADITPEKPVALVGQLHKRISTGVRDPLTATALAIETRSPDGTTEQAVLLSCDLVMSHRSVTDRLREAVKARVADLDVSKIVVNATHTHTGPGLDEKVFRGLYDVSGDAGVMQPSEYCEFFLQRAADAIVSAWEKRAPGGMSWALGSAAIGINRRAQFFDGTAAMYGDTRRDDFAGFEGSADPGVQMLFFWTPEQALTGVAINIACPSQETEGLLEVSADFWHDVRVELRRRHGADLFILPQCAAAGDNSPHPMFRKAAEEAMLKRKCVSRREELARRIADAVDDALPGAKNEIKPAAAFKHLLVEADLPELDPPAAPFYETDSVHPVKFHVIRLGDIAVATNPFELYLDYGLRIQSRSRAILTFPVQLSDSHSGYLPTAEAVRGGGYSADKYIVTPEGGQVLVEETVAAINSLWP